MFFYVGKHLAINTVNVNVKGKFYYLMTLCLNSYSSHYQNLFPIGCPSTHLLLFVTTPLELTAKWSSLT